MKHSLTILGAFLMIVAISCSTGTEEQKNGGTEEQRNAGTEENSINPNGVSELAALMRKMESHTKVMKAETEGGRYKSRTIPLSYKDLKTATPTKAEQKDETFDSFADAFMNAMEQYYQTDAPQALRYKRVVATCIACHQRLCPGPVKAISKLYIDSRPQLQLLD